MRTTSVVLVCLAACSSMPFKRKNSGGGGYQAPPGENELHWERGAVVDSFEGFRSYATGQVTSDPVPGLESSCGAPTSAHVLVGEIAHTLAGTETVYVSTHGSVIVSSGQVVATTAPVTDCAQLPSEIVAVHAGFWSKNTAFPNNPQQLVVIDRVGTQTRQRLLYHWPLGTLTESFSFVIGDTATPDVARRMRIGREGEEIYTEPYGIFHWEAEQARFVPGQKMSRPSRKSF